MTAVGVLELWHRAWAGDGGRSPRLVDASSGRGWSGAQVSEGSALVAGELASRGVRAGDSVVLSAAPCDATALAFVALLRLGAVVVPVNTAATAREVAHVVQVSGASLALVGDAGAHQGADQVRFEGLVPVVGLPDAGAVRSRLGGPPPEVALDAAGPRDRALICFTSGTTGLPKGAPVTHAALAAGTAALVECWDWSPDDTLVSALPLFHVHGLIVALGGSLTAGAAIVLHPRFDADAVVDSVREHGASLVFGVPTMWARLAESGRLEELAGLRLAVSGSAPLAPDLFEVLRRGMGSAPVERYGMTETLIITSTPVRGERRAGTVGRALPGMQVRVAGDGVVEVRGDSVFDGYLLQGPDEPPDRAGFTEDGWFRTGDVGEWDGDDLRLVGRASELIITGGYNVYPREVEDVLRGDPAVGDVAVVGLPDPVWGETVAAFVVLAPGCEGGVAEQERWDALCAAELAPYKRPRGWTVVAELPRNAMGKVRRDVLRERGSG